MLKPATYRKTFRYGTLAVLVSIPVVLSQCSQAWAQTDANVNSGQPNVGTMPPPTPPQAPQNAANNSAAAQERSMMSSQPSTMSSQPSTQTNRDQFTPLPPDQPNMNANASGALDRQAGRAELGVFLVPTDGAGVRIRDVTPGSAAEAVGLRSGDVILSVNGQNVAIANDVIERLRLLRPGDAVELRIWRDGVEQTVTATLREARQSELQASYMAPSGYIEGGVVQPYYMYGDRPVYQQRYYSYYPGAYGYGYGYGAWPYGYGDRSQYYGTPRFGYYNSPWGQGVNVGGFRFGWR